MAADDTIGLLAWNFQIIAGAGIQAVDEAIDRSKVDPPTLSVAMR
jgi:hypothetical protein